MSESRPTPRVTVEAASEEDAFVADWGREVFKSSLTLANDVLKQSITIASLLLGAAMGFLDKSGVSRSWQILVYGLLLTMLLVAFFSLLPAIAEIDIRDADALRAFRKRILCGKRRALQWVGGLLAAAFCAALIGAMTRAGS